MSNNELKHYMSDSEIINYIKNYIDKSSYPYAVLIDGSWGSGKTFFIKKNLMPAIEEYEKSKVDENYKEKKLIYISLYGITSKDEIARQIWLETFPLGGLIKSKPFHIVSNIGKVIVGGVLSSKNISIPDLSIDVCELTSVENCILFFDDLERCGMSINEVLGYVNNFVEHDGIKVIIIANEKEIATVNLVANKEIKYLVALNKGIIFPNDDHQDNLSSTSGVSIQKTDSDKFGLEELAKRIELLFGEDELYKQIKEKLIGVNIHYKPNITEIVDKITQQNISDERIRKIILENKDFIVGKFEKYHPNIRTLLFCFDKFNELAKSLIEDIDFEDLEDTLNNILKYTVILSIRYKSGEPLPEWKENIEIDTISISGHIHSFDYMTGYRFVDRYIKDTNFEKTKVSEIIKKHIDFLKSRMRDPKDPLYILSKNWWYMEDKDACNLLKIINQTLSKEPKKYDISCYSDIMYLNIVLSNIGVITDEVKDIVCKMKENIRLFEVQSTFNTFGWARSFEFENEEERKFFDEYMKSLYESLNYHRDEKVTNQINSIFNSLDSWSDKLLEYIMDNKFMEQKAFISLLEFDKLLNTLKNSTNKQLNDFRGIILSIYDFKNINEYFNSDKDSIDGLIKELNQYCLEIKNSEKIKAKILRYLIRDLDDLSKRLGK